MYWEAVPIISKEYNLQVKQGISIISTDVQDVGGAKVIILAENLFCMTIA
jgi:hypothetical protein